MTTRRGRRGRVLHTYRPHVAVRILGIAGTILAAIGLITFGPVPGSLLIVCAVALYVHDVHREARYRVRRIERNARRIGRNVL